MALEDKLARICWNTNNWQRPSGRSGKTSNPKAYEAKTGYGHEEWLFDINKLVDGYHYAYIQAIGQHRDIYIDKAFNIAFYTINSSTKERWWLGEIKNVQVVSRDESKKVYKSYEENDWLQEMYTQLEAVSADVAEFRDIKPEHFCCIKFRPIDMRILEEPMYFSSKDEAVKSDYYNLKNKTGVPAGIDFTDFVFSPGGIRKKGKTTITYREQVREIDLVHNQIQEAIYGQFVKKHGADNVSCELKTGYGTKVDIVIKNSEDYIFYEIKTANTAKECIREALSQLLEYAHYPNHERASKLVIIATIDLSDNAKAYLKKIRKLFNIPVFYQKFDFEQNKLGQEE